MFQKATISSLLPIVLMTSVAFADSVQLLDDRTSICFDQSFGAIPMPLKSFESGSYGNISAISPIKDNFMATVGIFTYQDVVTQSITHTFSGGVEWRLENGYRYSNSRSISISFNNEGQLTRIIEGGFHSDWNVSNYASYTHALKDPTYTTEQMGAITDWVEKAAQTMALMGLHCLADTEYNPPSGQAIEPPNFNDLRILTLH